MAISPQITNMAIMLFFFQASKKIPFENVEVLNGVRALYIISNILIASIYFYMQYKIDKKKDLTTLKYVEPPAMGSQDDPKLVTTTNHAYDTTQIRAGLKGQVIGTAIMAFMHLYLKYTNPLLVQSIIPFKSALESNLAKVYLWGQKDVGELKRPWKAGGGLMDMMGGGGGGAGPKTDKASIEAAEKAGRGGQKEE